MSAASVQTRMCSSEYALNGLIKGVTDNIPLEKMTQDKVPQLKRQRCVATYAAQSGESAGIMPR